ncbi:hypothetical protein KFE25_002045 [Diacronema lutheri]|uniref:Thioredoxin domain-containing protein n=1 Tax=Diacronema lutheri TaxID=2081491 RepID=A0A7R9YPN5_DIALT|nr:hypothetical protein KFE25_002045 [Diacronema lutheri]|mmetsp:Transcript_9058/g.28490  ORF Transcript_9058/g.28490 Transcript_9058/m.28490 type:complete len:166 (+) Transcript_9058:23-520(+)
MVAPGTKLPDIKLFEGQPDYAPATEHSLMELVKGKTVVLFAVPGAFTPSCSKAHLPSFIKHFDELKAAGVDHVICTATNDPFVMAAWAQASGVPPNTIHMLSDNTAELCRGLGVATESDVMVRSTRYALVAKDGVVTHFFPSEKDGEKCAQNTYADSVLGALKSA